MEGTWAIVLQITSALKLLRLITYQRYLYRVAEIYNLNATYFKTLLVFIEIALYFHFVCCFFLFLYTLDDKYYLEMDDDNGFA